MAAKLPADVLFAQKASAVSKCAGMDPRTMDLEKFRTNAALIFVRAYTAIYKENLNNGSEEDGAQVVIERLLERTGVSALETITGKDVVEGSHRAVGVLVGVLFAEGQRMWLAKQEEKKRLLRGLDDAGAEMEALTRRSKTAVAVSAHLLEDDGEGASPADPPVKRVRKVKKKSKKVQRPSTAGAVSMPQAAPAVAAAAAAAAASDLDKEHRHHQQPQPQPYDGDFEDYAEDEPAAADPSEQSAGPASPEDVQQLRSRIQFLESQLRLKATEQGPAVTASRGRIRRIRHKPSFPAVTTHSNATAEGYDEAPPSFEKALPPALPRAVRPSSAPSVGRKRPPQRRLYAVEGQDAGDLDGLDPRPPAALHDEPPPLPSYPASWYTYDMSSGRRILLSEAEREAALRRKKESMNVKSAVDIITGAQAAPGAVGAAMFAAASSPPRLADAPPRPTQAEWPGASTGRSTEDWVRRQREAREERSNKSAAMLAAIAEFSRPRSFASYSKLDKLDLVVSIEHCHNCAAHNVTLRHKPGEYIKNADAFLRALAVMMHEANLGARVGVTRFPTVISAKGSHTDADSRIGAFEIQIAFKNTSGNVSYDLLHSKLSTTRWPSKNVVEKRLRAFLSKHNVPTYYKRPDAGGYTDTAEAGLGSYPVGMGGFDETPLADPKWTFPSIAPPLVIESPTHSHGHSAHAHAAPDDGPLQGLGSVQWVFDGRDVVVAPQYEVGTTVYVSDVVNKINKTERHPLLGVVKSAPVDPTGSMRVRLKYHSQESVVTERQLMAISDHIPDDEGVSPDDVPLHLCTLLLLAGLIQTGQSLEGLPIIATKSPILFRVNEPDDSKSSEGAVLLGRSSLFHQLRTLAASVEAKCADEDRLVTHAALGTPVDVQLAYGESTLSWIQARFGQSANTLELQKTMVEHAVAFGVPRGGRRQTPQKQEVKAIKAEAAPVLAPEVVPVAAPAAASPKAVDHPTAATASPLPTPTPTNGAPTPTPSPAPTASASATTAATDTQNEVTEEDQQNETDQIGEGEGEEAGPSTTAEADLGFTVDDEAGDGQTDHYKDLLFDEDDGADGEEDGGYEEGEFDD